MAENNNVSAEEKNTGKFEINVEKPINFDNMEGQAILTSREFCRKYVNPLFKPVFADYIGSIYTVDQRGMAQIVLYFDRKDHGDKVTATSKTPSNDGMINESVNTVRRYANRAVNGDKYYFTEEGKQGLEKFFYNEVRKRTKDGFKVDYSKVKTTTSLGGGYNGFNNGFYFGAPTTGQQVTAVSFISPTKIAETLFGLEADGHKFEYDVHIIRSAMNQYAIASGSDSRNYLISVQRLDATRLNDLCAELGLIGGGIDMIQA